MLDFLHKKEKPLRQQLLEAKERIERQLEILRQGSSMTEPAPDNRSIIETLAAELAEIDDALANLKDANA